MNRNEGLTAFTAAFVDELARAGVREVVISPGSRSTPLAMLFNAHPDTRIWIDVDERSAAFFALGLAKGAGKPVALVCSSGTATANYFPAVIEARYSRIPLIVLTADRPHELREVGAPQAIDQVKLYGDHVKWHQDMPIPEDGEALAAFARTSARRAFLMAGAAPEGPVHVNFPFREPLVPDLDRTPLWEAGRTAGGMYNSHIARGVASLANEDYKALADVWRTVEKPLIIAGPLRHPRLKEALLHLARVLDAPVLADPLSGLRSGTRGDERVIDSYDAFLRAPAFSERVRPDGILRFGAMPVSKPLLKYLEACRPKVHIIVDEADPWRDPTHTASGVIHADPAAFCRDWAEALGASMKHAEWVALWESVNGITADTVTRFVREQEWFEGRVVTELVEAIDRGALFAGNSMPIRDVDTFFLKTDKAIEVFANRGANGIDGVVSTALGTGVSAGPLHLLIGDLSFFHDMNGLMVAKRHGLDATLIVINNNGGGIFSFLPQAESAEADFETLFGTPLDLDIRAVAAVYQAFYKKATDAAELRAALAEARSVKGLKIIEAVTDRRQNTAIHKSLWQTVAAAVAAALDA